MKSNRPIGIVIGLLGASLALAGCDGFFGANVFSVVETRSGVDVAQLLNEESLSDLAAALESGDTYDQMNEEDVADTESFLLRVVEAPGDEQSRATASEALTALYRNTTTAGAAVTSVSPLIEALLIADASEDFGSLSAGDLFEALVPEEAIASQAAFDELVAAFLDFDAAYDAMNQALAEPQVGISAPGTAFQGALITHLVTGTLDTMDIDGQPATEETVGAKTVVIYRALTGDEDDRAALEDALTGFSPEDLLAGSNDEGSGMENIVEEAGFADVLSSLVDSVSGEEG